MNEHRRIVGRPFAKGQSGNAGGRPKELRDVIEQARSHATDAIKTLVAAMNSDSAPWAARITAANATLDRGWGKPRVPMDMKVTATLEDYLLASFRRDAEVETTAARRTPEPCDHQNDRLA
jgi:hypothetical protein